MPNFPTPKESRHRKFQTQQSPSMIAVTNNREYLHWGFVPPQISLSNVLLMTHFITAKQIVKNKAESERPTSKRETTTNGKINQGSSIFWKPKYTQLENEAPSTPVKGPAII